VPFILFNLRKKKIKPSKLIDENGSVVALYNYGPWGETDIVHDDDGSGAASPTRYTGREMDDKKLLYI